LFFAVTIVCMARGLFWWWKWLRERNRVRSTVPLTQAIARSAA
jgi:enediyne biosynthesis protein E5